ncbi:MAG: NAD(P)/FAD-dependent oxidoreductase [Chitinophagaceae bacterium]|nr:MAG: flavoprotein [Bacteroidetes bacterium OLB11]MCC6448628.1 NAD(P)/FAD-dependent oxidoreductase [Chitinophagaceae bacterium]HMN32288.1 NAD(P)/FAD-dependent oxidoreductase [Chitinophagaceae bacterium]
MSKQLIVIGGGASGFFCAINVAMQNQSLQITIIEKQKNVLQKVKVSGGGRCNVTHACFQNSKLVTFYPRGKNFLKKTFSLFSTKDTVQWFANQGVQLHTEADGRMFPTSNHSDSIIQCFLNLTSQYRIALKTNTEIISIEKNGFSYILKDKNGYPYTADFVMIATGGYHKDSQYQWLQKLGHTFIHPVPSLFTFNLAHSSINTLMGVSVENILVKIAGTKFSEQGPLLITHWGFSGPAILRLSAWAARTLHEMNYHFSIQINWINQEEHQVRLHWNTIREKQAGLLISNKNPFQIPQRLWHFILTEANIDFNTKWSELTSKAQNKLIHRLTAQAFEVKGKTTFKEEFVTCGGIPLNEVDPQTMQSKLAKNIYFGGEILDVDGITGGFNFQHAWSCGMIASRSIVNHSI